MDNDREVLASIRRDLHRLAVYFSMASEYTRRGLLDEAAKTMANGALLVDDLGGILDEMFARWDVGVEKTEQVERWWAGLQKTLTGDTDATLPRLLDDLERSVDAAKAERVRVKARRLAGAPSLGCPFDCGHEPFRNNGALTSHVRAKHDAMYGLEETEEDPGSGDRGTAGDDSEVSLKVGSPGPVDSGGSEASAPTGRVVHVADVSLGIGVDDAPPDADPLEAITRPEAVARPGASNGKASEHNVIKRGDSWFVRCPVCHEREEVDVAAWDNTYTDEEVERALEFHGKSCAGSPARGRA